MGLWLENVYSKKSSTCDASPNTQKHGFANITSFYINHYGKFVINTNLCISIYFPLFSPTYENKIKLCKYAM